VWIIGVKLKSSKAVNFESNKLVKLFKDLGTNNIIGFLMCTLMCTFEIYEVKKIFDFLFESPY